MLQTDCSSQPLLEEDETCNTCIAQLRTEKAHPSYEGDACQLLLRAVRKNLSLAHILRLDHSLQLLASRPDWTVDATLREGAALQEACVDLGNSCDDATGCVNPLCQECTVLWSAGTPNRGQANSTFECASSS